jgi:hypothetical protein
MTVVSCLRGFGLAVAMGTALLWALPAGAAEEESREFFLQGVAAYRERDYEKAAVSFERFLEHHPSADLVLALRRQAGSEVLREMLSHEQLDAVVRRIMALSSRGEREALLDPERIAGWVGLLDLGRQTASAGQTEIAYWEARDRLARVGTPAVPMLLDRLVDPKQDTVRARVMLVLEDMGSSAVLPLVEALQSKSPLLRQSAASVLGRAGDRRAVPALKELWAREQDPAIRQTAWEAIGKIAGMPPEELPPTEELFYHLAVYFLRREILSAQEALLYDDGGGELAAVWRWSGAEERVVPLDLVTYRDTAGRERPGYVPAFAVNEFLAEEACYDALAARPDYEPAVPLLLCIYLSQAEEVRDLLDRMGDQASPQARRLLEARQSALGRAYLFAYVAGARYVYPALRRALDDRDATLALDLMEVLQQVGDGESLPESMETLNRLRAGTLERFFPVSDRFRLE